MGGCSCWVNRRTPGKKD
uniref:Uncharacterized protein n=1 Tax=Anguilla anguilla TaxID=7936 RepID=A0A0E9VTE4_ANGAN